jgi:hypothetical protein
MTITDSNLAALVASLPPAERKAVADHLQGRASDLSREALRRIRASLKRRARSRLPRKLVWLG